MKLNLKDKRVLIMAPHTDDGEFGCGGTINKIIKEGADVYYAAFSACRQSVRSEVPPDILITEVKAATKILGVPSANLILFDYDVRTFNFRRQEILDNILQLKKDINPDLVFIPSLNDMHQDHETIANESVRAFKFTTVLSYEVPWNNLNFHTTCFFHLKEEEIESKINALKEYKSQAHRTYANEEFIRGLARTRGVQCGVSHAEVFEVIRLIIN
jgi:LmbE family N-acetylglucosaminyl deacetylase